MTDCRRYVKGAELPDLTIAWRDRNGAPVAFLSGWTFTLNVARADSPATFALTKTTGIVGADTIPNVTIQWTTADLAGLNPGKHLCELWARRTSDSKDRDPFTFMIEIGVPLGP